MNRGALLCTRDGGSTSDEYIGKTCICVEKHLDGETFLSVFEHVLAALMTRVGQKYKEAPSLRKEKPMTPLHAPNCRGSMPRVISTTIGDMVGAQQEKYCRDG
ncbi:hypothetical protein KIN20_004434 [Parelaphostrongylus tenuis]|uniref:Uncharacterized protein n=1 Tax=Parelaphostrongylus tenuis TaxID=148309 RepID=A0AAD5M341_PARTN|nr:hypothetical protein KIN20_004434 [Parelaphostrongylus tenuis]